LDINFFFTLFVSTPDLVLPFLYASTQAAGDHSTVQFISLNTRESMADMLRTDGTPAAIKANRYAIAVVVRHRIYLYSVLGLNSLCTIEGEAEGWLVCRTCGTRQ
jgi:hypothetical protein